MERLLHGSNNDIYYLAFYHTKFRYALLYPLSNTNICSYQYRMYYPFVLSKNKEEKELFFQNEKFIFLLKRKQDMKDSLHLN